MSILPTFGRHVVKEDKTEVKVAGLYLPVTDADPNKKFVKGVVLVASKGYYAMTGEWVNSQIEVGDIIWYNKYNVAEVQDGRDNYDILDEKDILIYNRR